MFSVLHFRFEPACEPSERHATVRDGEFPLLGDMRQRGSISREVEDRVVTEPVATFGGIGDLSFDGASCLIDHASVMNHRNRADEPRGLRRAWLLCQATIDLGKPFGLGGVGPEDTRGVDAGLTTERVDLETGILRNGVEGAALNSGGRLCHEAVVRERLDAGVLFE